MRPRTGSEFQSSFDKLKGLGAVIKGSQNACKLRFIPYTLDCGLSYRDSIELDARDIELIRSTGFTIPTRGGENLMIYKIIFSEKLDPASETHLKNIALQDSYSHAIVHLQRNGQPFGGTIRRGQSFFAAGEDCDCECCHQGGGCCHDSGATCECDG